MGTERGHLIKHSKCTATNGRSVCSYTIKYLPWFCLATQSKTDCFLSLLSYLLQMDYILIMNGHGEHEN